MKNSFCLSGLAAALLGLGVVHGQGPTYSPGPTGIPPASPPGVQAGPSGPGPLTAGQPTNGIGSLFAPDQPAAPDQTPSGGGISSWLAYPRGPGCCCRVGGDGPIEAEIYLRSGVSVPFGSGVYANDLRPGWDIEGGVRTLFFNKEGDAAWTADLGITNMYFKTLPFRQVTITNFVQQVPNGLGGTTPVNIPTLLVTPTNLNDTFVNISGGRETYLLGGAACCNGEARWRVGWDLGGRWGTSRLDMDRGATTTGGEMHKTGSISGVFMSVHSDIEVPCSCWIIFAGVRAEYGYIFSDILQGQNNLNLQTANLMFTIGGRF